MATEGVELSENPPEYSDAPNGEASLLSFIVRLWIEESVPEANQTSWRGHITSVPNGQRQYFTSITQIPDLIIALLKLQK